jgi:hypothetical protein
MFATEYPVSLKGAMYMWVMALAMIGIIILIMMGVMVLVMFVLHRKPRRASVPDVRGPGRIENH